MASFFKRRGAEGRGQLLVGVGCTPGVGRLDVQEDLMALIPESLLQPAEGLALIELEDADAPDLDRLALVRGVEVLLLPCRIERVCAQVEHIMCLARKELVVDGLQGDVEPLGHGVLERRVESGLLTPLRPLLGISELVVLEDLALGSGQGLGLAESDVLVFQQVRRRRRRRLCLCGSEGVSDLVAQARIGVRREASEKIFRLRTPHGSRWVQVRGEASSSVLAHGVRACAMQASFPSRYHCETQAVARLCVGGW
mmetsp:Transcript_34344/g.84506  ORF Transcript_34344/g.84506 Transcript_34344/m.84506 type:complete len:255 (-) Transcript_34344:3978-4742(-)